MLLAKIRKIVSGGQTGVDRAALDFALAAGIETGGYVPKNRRAEDGRISPEYANLIETESEDPARRTELNVMNSDATLILSRGKLVGGSLLTKELAEKCGKPFLHVDLSVLTPARAADESRRWLDLIECETLNVAGSRASEDAGIYAETKEFLGKLFNAGSL